MLSNCGAGEDSWESLGLQGDQPWIFIAGLMLKLKLQCFNHLMWRANSLEKTLMLGKIEGRRRRGWQRMRWLDGIIDSMGMSFSKFREMVKNREAWYAAAHGVAKSWTRLSDWTERQPGYHRFSHHRLTLQSFQIHWLQLPWVLTLVVSHGFTFLGDLCSSESYKTFIMRHMCTEGTPRGGYKWTEVKKVYIEMQWVQ